MSRILFGSIYQVCDIALWLLQLTVKALGPCRLRVCVCYF